MADHSQAILTVVEAARVLRISRGLAYELARRWLETDGREGLPVIKLGRALRDAAASIEQAHRSEPTNVAMPTLGRKLHQQGQLERDQGMSIGL